MKSRQTKKPRQDSSACKHVAPGAVKTSTASASRAEMVAAHRHTQRTTNSSSQDFGSPSDFPRLAQYILHESSLEGKKADPQTQDAGLTILEDVDAVQMELEALWTNVSIRIRTLKASQVIVNESAGCSSKDASGKNTKSGVRTAKLSQNSATPTVRRKNKVSSPISAMKAAIFSRRSKKKLRGDRSSTDSKSSTHGSTKPTRSGQNRAHSMSQESVYSKLPPPGHFWDFVDSYCRDLTYDDLETLEKTLQEHSSAIDNIFDIPPLGKHFRAKDTENSTTTTTTRLTREKVHDRSRDICGPLTQRLVSALVDNRVHNYKKNASGTGEETTDGLFMNRPGLATALGLEPANGVDSGGSGGTLPGEHNLESRLRNMLTDQGLLLPEGSLLSSLEEKDEILVDILRTQERLRSLHQNNADKLEQLQSLAKREITRSQVKLEMEKADKEVLEAYRLISTSRAKKKPLTKRERDLATRALNHRKIALGKLQKPEQSSASELDGEGNLDQ